MVFRLSFFGAFFVDGTLFLTQLLMFNSIYANVDSIGDWSKGEMTIFIGTFSLINALNMVIYFFGINSLPDKIRSGSLDFYITKPVNPLLRITFENVNPGSIPLIIFSIVIILYGVSISDVTISISTWILYGVHVLLMTILFYDTELIIRTVSFFVISTVNFTRIENLIELCMKVPGVLFKGIFKFLFYFVLPYGIMATIPTQVLMSTITLEGIAYGIIIAVGFTAFALWLWDVGLKHYKSASS
ncbi:MAG: hypothetical protein K0S47_1037 [Herbinix sp.]|jgi:ABC-2 type transport system permease protein|nr:hypothetical protein [Herbinix sp.]